MAGVEFSFLKTFLRKTHNREVNEWFRDIYEDETFNTGRTSAKRACLIKPNDSQNICLLKMINFYFGIQQAHHKPDIFGVPASLLIESVKVLPQVILHWRERTDIAKANNREPHKVRHSIRWRDDYSSKASVDLLRGKVERAFVEPLHFFDSGREKWTYRDEEKSHTIIAATPNRTEAEKVIRPMLDLVDDLFEGNFLSRSEAPDRNWEATELERLDGESVRTQKRRPMAKVYFTHAELYVPKIRKSVKLIDRRKSRVPVSYFI